jgi:hypothetical protein
MKINRGRQQRPRRVLLYGQEGVGKSSWAAQAPRPLFLDFEGGLGDLDVESSPRLETWDSLREAMNWIMTEPHDYQSIVFDTVDWMEHLLHRFVCAKSNVESIEKAAGGYGKGYTEAATILQGFLANCERMMARRNLNIILLGHCSPVKVNDPEAEMYEQWAPDLHKTAAALLREWCDEVLFASFRTDIRGAATNDDKGKKPKRFLAMGTDERYIRTQRSAAVQAKNRLSLPPELPIVWSEYQKHWPVGVTGQVKVESVNQEGEVVSDE